jgi:HD-like signal output (HDOD) protein
VKRILFVDDDASVLDALRNLLRKRRNEWDMVFAVGGQAALLELGKAAAGGAAFDVVVTDMRMPGMDGAELLKHVRDRFPGTARIVLSGHAERDAIVRALPVTHQFLNKPCDAAMLRGVVARTCNLQALLQNETTRSVIGKLDRLPSPPATYLRLTEAMADPKVTSKLVAAIVEEDPAMTVKVLQLVNSAYFGLAHAATSVGQAVTYLGLEVLRSLTLSAHVFSTAEGTGICRAALDEIQRSSLATATIAKRLLKNRELANDAFTAGIIHDVGRIVIALALPDKHREIGVRARETTRAECSVEQEVLGVTHAEVGAYLLGVWGLPFSIVETTAFHHAPSGAANDAPDVLAAVHLAEAVVHAETAGEPELDRAFLERVGLASEIDAWRAAAADYFARLGAAAPRRAANG